VTRPAPPEEVDVAMTRDALRQRRRQQEFTQETMAFALGVSPTTYRDWERGIAMPRAGFRPRLARELDVSLAEVARLLEGDERLAVPGGLAVPAWLGHFAALEQGAARLWSYEPVAVPGLLQTPEYTAALQHGDPADLSEADVARRVEARRARQNVVFRERDPLILSVVLDESVLHRVAGDRTVMRGQLDHLVVTASLPNVTIRVLPLHAGVFSAAWGSFTVITSPGSTDPYMACVEDRVGMHYLDRPNEVEEHVALYEHLSAVALSPTESLTLINAAKESYP
jgi:DNA-binding XRE family transcriptional regulator